MIDPAPVKMILFDLDGTLVDSAADLAWSVDAMLEDLHLPLQGELKVRQWIGNGVNRLIHRALTGSQEGEAESAAFNRGKALFLNHYAGHFNKASRLYPGVRSALETWAGLELTLGCVTNKPRRFTNPLLEHLGIDHFFKLIISGDTLTVQKPDPKPLLYACEQLDIMPQASLMVGDSENDVTAAKAAGFQSVAVSYGYNHGVPVAQTNPDLVTDRLDDLAALWTRPASVQEKRSGTAGY